MSDSHPSDQNAKTLLLFERDRMVSGSLTLQLQGAGWQVKEAPNTTAVHSYFTPNLFRVALIDLAEPESEGVALANELGQADPNLLIIVMCSYRALNESMEEINLEHYDYLLKPVRLDQLELVMRKGRREFGLVQENRRLKIELGQLKQHVQELEVALAEHDSKQQADDESLKIPGRALRPGGAAIATYERFMHRSASADESTAQEEKADTVAPDEDQDLVKGEIVEALPQSNIIEAVEGGTQLPVADEQDDLSDEESDDEELDDEE